MVKTFAKANIKIFWSYLNMLDFLTFCKKKNKIDIYYVNINLKSSVTYTNFCWRDWWKMDLTRNKFTNVKTYVVKTQKYVLC